MQNKKFQNPKKYFYHDDMGNMLSGSGVIPMDNDGVWLITENYRGNMIVSDMGGKYRDEDASIHGCAAREFNEETYFSREMTRRYILDNYFSCIYVRGHTKDFVYVCFMVSIDKNFKDIKKEFKKNYTEAVKTNPGSDKYKSVDICYYTNSEIKDMLGKQGGIHPRTRIILDSYIKNRNLKDDVSSNLLNHLLGLMSEETN